MRRTNYIQIILILRRKIRKKEKQGIKIMRLYKEKKIKIPNNEFKNIEKKHTKKPKKPQKITHLIAEEKRPTFYGAD